MKKKGFTLIELLAVIVILAVIALIAVPVVMNIIEKANKSAFKDSAYGILKAGELYYTEQQMSLNSIEEEKVFTFPNDIEGLEINGSKPTDGTVVVNKKGQISIAITNGRYCVTKGYEDGDVTIIELTGKCKNPAMPNTLSDIATSGTFTYEIGYDVTIDKVNPCAISGICELGTPFAIQVNNNETYQFFVINDDGKEVTLIMDRNLGNNVAWYIDENDTNATNAKGPLTALNELKKRTNEWTNIPTYTYTLENDDDAQGGTYPSYPSITGESVTDVRARLPRYNELIKEKIDCATTNNTCKAYITSNIDKITTFGYWLSTSYSGGNANAWAVSRWSSLSNTPYNGSTWVNDGSYLGLRPVITLTK